MACCFLRVAAAPRLLLYRAAASRQLPSPLTVFRKVNVTLNPFSSFGVTTCERSVFVGRPLALVAAGSSRAIYWYLDCIAMIYAFILIFDVQNRNCVVRLLC